MAHLEGAYEQAGQRLTSIDQQFDALDRKIDLRFDALDNKIDRRYMWTIGVVIASWVTTVLSTFLHR